MAFTYRNPARSTEPDRALPGVAALVVAARAYDHDDAPQPRRSATGRVAAYARADHYGELRAGLRRIADRLRADGWRCRVLVDDNAIVDREAAYRAGLGWYGKNANLLLPGRGSWFVLGSVLTTAPLPADAAPVDDGCGSCRRCIDACPTGAIVAAGVVDARRCLAWLVQAPGPFPVEFREALGDRLYGCDDCQTVCPINRRGDRAAASTTTTTAPTATATATATAADSPRSVAFRSRISGPQGDRTDSEPAPAPTFVDVVELLGASDDELMARHGRWYIPRRDPRYLRRNALVVLGNVGLRRRPGGGGHGAPLLRARRSAAARACRVGGRAARSRRSAGVRHLLVTNDFPPKIGGIQYYLWELWRRLPADDFVVLTTPHPEAAAWDARQDFRVERTQERVLLPTRGLARRIDRVAAERRRRARAPRPGPAARACSAAGWVSPMASCSTAPR